MTFSEAGKKRRSREKNAKTSLYDGFVCGEIEKLEGQWKTDDATLRWENLCFTGMV